MATTRQATLQRIKRHLANGKKPSQFGARYLNEGCYKKAYRLGPFVIKNEHHEDDASRAKRFPKKLVEKGLYPPREWRIKGWIVQPFYSKLSPKQAEHVDKLGNCCDFWNDIKPANVGLDHLGRYVAFDW